jgi:hypothetical protein
LYFLKSLFLSLILLLCCIYCLPYSPSIPHLLYSITSNIALTSIPCSSQTNHHVHQPYLSNIPHSCTHNGFPKVCPIYFHQQFSPPFCQPIHTVLTPDLFSGRNGIFFTVAAAGSAFLITSYRIAAQDTRNSQPGNLHVRTERSGGGI